MFKLTAVLILGFLAWPTGQVAAQDATAGEKVFNKCKACHRIGPKAKNTVGPHQNSLMGRTAGTVPEYRYSKLNKAAGEAGLIWTEETVFEYLADPSKFLKEYLKDNGKAAQASGASKMPFKLPKEQERKDVIAYIATFSEKTE